jgi:predicted AlkP superfamily pyrophosphatase or phosphodiesterase
MRCALLAALLFASPAVGADGPAPKKPKVKLAVLVVFDQMRGDYVEKWKPHFGEGGFARMQADGAWFADCHYPYGTTTTAPGHASILSGCGASKHGIVNNDWYDRAAGSTVYAAGSTRYQLVPQPPADPAAGKPKPRVVGNPDRFVGPTLADVLKETTGGRGKVFGVSLKDRSAVLPSGRRPDGAYWFSGGSFVTTTYYRDSLPGWVEKFNAGGLADSYFKKSWERLRPDLDYAAIVGPDAGPGETGGTPAGRSFPHSLTGGKDKVGSSYYSALASSPFGNELLLAFAKQCVIAEKLGQDDVPDLLTVSFSSNDLIGHGFGPDSQEVLDVTLRSDKVVGELMNFLDAQVGKGKYSLVITADHGVTSLPEAARARGIDARRVPTDSIVKGAEAHLRATYGQANPDAPTEAKPGTPKPAKPDRNLWIENVSFPSYYLNRKLVKARGLEVDSVAETLAAYLRKQDGLARAYTAKRLAATDDPGSDEFLTPTRLSYYADRSGDVVIVVQPHTLLGTSTSGTTHGSPHEYDRHTVFLAYGPGVGGGRRDEKITPLHASAIVADFLGVAPPSNNQYGLPKTLTQAPAAVGK